MTEEEDEAEVSRRLVARDKFNELELNKCQIVESLIVVKRMCLTTDWKAKHSDLAGRFVKTSQELHAALCEGAFSIDRDPNEARKLGYIQYGGKYWTPTEIGQWFLYLDNLKVSEASDVVKSRGCNLRVIRDGGHDMIVTSDLDRMRVNVEVKDGVVVRVFSLG